MAHLSLMMKWVEWLLMRGIVQTLFDCLTVFFLDIFCNIITDRNDGQNYKNISLIPECYCSLQTDAVQPKHFFSNSQKFISDSNGDHKVSRDIKYFRLMLWEMWWCSRNLGFQYSLSENSFNQELEQTDKCDVLSVWDCNFTTINLLWKGKLKET